MTPQPRDPIVPIDPATELSYDQSAILMNDFTFRGRVKVAILRFADSIMLEAATVSGHNARLRWAVQVFQQPENTAGQIQAPTVMDPGIQSAGSAVTDADLQTAVEATVAKLLSSQ